MTAAIEPKFKVGDRILHKCSGKIYIVLDRIHNEAEVAYQMKVYTDGKSTIEPTTIAEHWTYKLDDGKSWWYVENLLELC
ncbi:hypothetical protein [Nostoc sp.]